MLNLNLNGHSAAVCPPVHSPGVPSNAPLPAHAPATGECRSQPEPQRSSAALADHAGEGGLGGGEADLLGELAASSLGPLARLRETIDLTLEQVSEWIARPESRRHIFNLVGLLDAQAQLLVSQQRLTAAAQLARLAASDDTPPETLRRACKDLLNIRIIERARPSRSRGGNDLEPLPRPRLARMPHDLLNELRRMEFGASAR